MIIKTNKEQVFIRVMAKTKKKFLKKLAAYENVTLHHIILKEDSERWDSERSEIVPPKMYGALLSYDKE